MTTVKLRDLEVSSKFKLHPTSKVYMKICTHSPGHHQMTCSVLTTGIRKGTKRYDDPFKEVIPVQPLPFLTQLFNKIFA